MMLNVYSFFDNKASFFSAPFFMSHDGLAIRAATDLVNDPSTTMGRHPADFNLMRLGTWDDQTASFSPCIPENMAVLSAFLPATQQGALFNG